MRENIQCHVSDESSTDVVKRANAELRSPKRIAATVHDAVMAETRLS